jgi:hypothetical protein
MAEKARSCGLAFKPDHLVLTETNPDAAARREGIQVAPNYADTLHISRKGIYLLQPAYDRRLAGGNGAAVDGGGLASGARRRYDKDEHYRPAGLSDWLAAGKRIAQTQDGPAAP